MPDEISPLAITMGDACGVGPEIVVRAFNERKLPNNSVIFGDSEVMEAAAKMFAPQTILNCVDSLSDLQDGALNIKNGRTLSPKDLTPGRISQGSGRAAYEYVRAAASAALRGEVSAIVTLPINKEATQLTYKNFSGHTELLAELCRVNEVVMMLAIEEVAVSHVSTHLSLRKAIEQLTPQRLTRVIELTHNALTQFIKRPRIGICGLNPHAGESGLFGDEEQRVIEPVIESLQQRSLDVTGPYPADTVFRQAIVHDEFDALICMYHDQGHAPMKLLAFDRAVNVTLGLPIIRTSVDHGTAFDIAWKGVARIDSLIHAIQYAQKLTKVKLANNNREIA